MTESYCVPRLENYHIIMTPLPVESRVDCTAYVDTSGELDRMTINAIQYSQPSRTANSVPLPGTWYTHHCNLLVLAS